MSADIGPSAVICELRPATVPMVLAPDRLVATVLRAVVSPATVFTLAILLPTLLTLVILLATVSISDVVSCKSWATVSISDMASLRSLATVTTSAMLVATVLTEFMLAETVDILVALFPTACT